MWIIIPYGTTVQNKCKPYTAVAKAGATTRNSPARCARALSVYLQSVTFELSFGTDTFNVSPNQSPAADLI
jgi:hypothetical protein